LKKAEEKKPAQKKVEEPNEKLSPEQVLLKIIKDINYDSVMV